MAVDKNRLEEEACILRFYKIVLSWDYIRLLKESQVGPVIYMFSWFLSSSIFLCVLALTNDLFFKKIILKQKHKENGGEGSSQGLKEVKDRYKDVEDYIATFEPLLFEEVKAQIVQGKDEDEGAFTFLDYSNFFLLRLFEILL